MEAGQLQLGDRRDDSRSKYDDVDEMIGELGSESPRARADRDSRPLPAAFP